MPNCSKINFYKVSFISHILSSLNLQIDRFINHRQKISFMHPHTPSCKDDPLNAKGGSQTPKKKQSTLIFRVMGENNKQRLDFTNLIDQQLVNKDQIADHARITRNCQIKNSENETVKGKMIDIPMAAIHSVQNSEKQKYEAIIYLLSQKELDIKNLSAKLNGNSKSSSSDLSNDRAATIKQILDYYCKQVKSHKDSSIPKFVLTSFYKIQEQDQQKIVLTIKQFIKNNIDLEDCKLLQGLKLKIQDAIINRMSKWKLYDLKNNKDSEQKQEDTDKSLQLIRNQLINIKSSLEFETDSKNESFANLQNNSQTEKPKQQNELSIESSSKITGIQIESNESNQTKTYDYRRFCCALI